MKTHGGHLCKFLILASRHTTNYFDKTIHMKKIIYLALFLLFCTAAFSQKGMQRATVKFKPHQLNKAKTEMPDGTSVFKSSALGEVPLKEIEPFLAYSISWKAESWDENNHFEIVFHDGNEQGKPIPVSPDSHFEKTDENYFSQLFYTDKNATKFHLNYTGSAEMEWAEVHFFSPGKTEKTPEMTTPPAGDKTACPCPQPSYLDRLGWCPDGSCPKNNPVATIPTHLIIHHSAGSNTASDWAAVVRSIWNFHVNDRGWDDIGYNWLVDPNGVLYEGRGDNIRGAHYCGKNSGTMGTCVMGDFTNVAPTSNAVGKLSELLAWKSCDAGLDPLGSGWHNASNATVMHISGHRDGCSTECPGNMFYPTIPSIRETVYDMLVNGCSSFFIAAPTNIMAEHTLAGPIHVTWEDNADNEQGYELERSFMHNNNFLKIAELPANTTSYEDEGVTILSFDYYYRVKAVFGDSSSVYSNEAHLSPATATSDLLNKSTVQISPNPTNGSVNVFIKNEFIGNMEATVFNALGQQMSWQININKNRPDIQFELDLNNFSNGIYFIKITQEEAVGAFRVLKKQ